MIGGYCGKILDVDLSVSSIKVFDVDEGILRHYIGGRGLATKILWDNLGKKWSKVDPLSPENILIIATGPLTGFYPGGRVCISGKSPQSNGIIGSTVGGEFGIDLKCAGYDAIVIRGASKDPVYLWIKDDEIEILDASKYWGLDGKDTLVRITKDALNELNGRYKRFGEWKDPSVLYIGPAGENMCRVAVVMEKWTHAAGYGGYGAVMGSKKLKAIVAKGSGPLPEVHNPIRFHNLLLKAYDELAGRDGMRRWGTGSGGYSVGAIQSSEPVRNWQDEWHDERSFGVDEFERRVWIKRYWGDYGCPTTCLKISLVKHGPYAGSLTDNPDYELQAYVGTNLGIFTPEGNVHVASIIDDMGICGINGGNVLGFAAELYQRGILTKEDFGGLDLSWGNAKAFGELAKMIAYRIGIGDILAEGTYKAALKLGEMKGLDLLPYAIQVKGVAVGAHGIRSRMDYPTPIAYACSVQCGDHTSVARLPIDSGGSELIRIMCDSAVICIFNFFPNPSLMWEFYEAITGIKLSPREWCYGDGLRILTIQRAVLLLGGPDFYWDPKVHDDNPLRFYEPLPSGPYKGQAADRSEVESLKKQYYEAVGWDEYGIPKSEKLKELGLEDVDEALIEVRKRFKSI